MIIDASLLGFLIGYLIVMSFVGPIDNWLSRREQRQEPKGEPFDLMESLLSPEFEQKLIEVAKERC